MYSIQDRFLYACKYGHIKTVKKLIKHVDPSFANNDSIGVAARNGHLAIVELLLSDPRVNPADYFNWAIRIASLNGHLDVVKLLLSDPRVDPSDCNNWALRNASVCGKLEIVKFLLSIPSVYSSTCSNWAINESIMYATEQGHTDVAELLTQHQYQLDKSKYLEMAKMKIN